MSETYTPPTVKGHGPLGVILGLVFSGLLFLALALAQMQDPDPPGPDEFNEISTSIEPPPIEEIEEEEPPPPEEDEPPPELEEPPPPIDLQMLDAALNPGSGGAGAIDLSLPGMSAGQTDVDLKDVFNIDDLDNDPQPRRAPRPDIPSRFLSRGREWRVDVRMEVGTDGQVERIVNIESTEPDLVGPVRRAVEQYEFEPGTREGRPVSYYVDRTFRFP
ncbi:MAG: energy transducer TonB [Opitutales bacterium]